ncbi:hypothetical protein Q0Q83_22035 [Escherichia marmotae]|uniref:hypothetical protein n=1 Tax=Escherichia marmotae TaxID=1499973 RepID=UPI002F302E2A
MIARTLFFLFLFFSMELEAANWIDDGTDWKFTVSDTISNTDKTPGEWVDLGVLSLPTYASLTMNTSATSNAACINRFCIGGTVTATRLNKINYELTVTFTPQTWTDDKNLTWGVALAWPDGLPTIEVGDYNSHSGNHEYTQLTLNAPTTPEYRVAALSGKSQTQCGIALGTCDMSLSTYFYTGSSKPHLYIKIPENVSQSSIDFSSIASKMKNLMHMNLYIYNNAVTSTVQKDIYAYPSSGSFSIPQRCSLNLDNTKLSFPSIKRGDNNGLLSMSSIIITTTCTNAPTNTKQYISVQPVTGGEIVNNKYVTHKDNSGNPALGFVYSLDSTSLNCDKGESFNTASLLRSLSGSNSEIYKNTINFGICKYGIPLQYGESNATIKIVTRWETP